MLAFEVDVREICEKIGLTYKSVKKYERILDSEEYMQLLEMGKREKTSELEDYKELIIDLSENLVCLNKKPDD